MSRWLVILTKFDIEYIMTKVIKGRAVAEFLALNVVEGEEHAVYYLGKKFLPYEEKYNLVEKTCLIMIWATRKLRHYFQSYKIQVVLKIDPLRYLFQVPALTGKISRWLVLLIEFDIEYIMTKVIKDRAVAEFLALNAVEREE